MRYMRDKVVAQTLGVNRATVWRWASNPDLGFPKPVKIGPNTTVWSETAIAAFVARRISRERPLAA